MKALVFEPHDDDLVIGMGGTALKMLDKGWEFKTVQMTDGRHGSNVIEPEELVKIRRQEKKDETKYLGIECEFLDYEDGALWEKMQNSSEEAVSDISKILSDYEPDVIFMSARDEGHPDHRATNLLVSKAIQKSEINPLKLSYLVWQLPFLEGENLVNKVIRAEVEEVYDEKLEALRLHESQIEEGRYDEMVENFNNYLGLLYASYEDDSAKSEVLGIQNPDKLKKLEEIEFEDVSELSHGRTTKNIKLE